MPEDHPDTPTKAARAFDSVRNMARLLLDEDASDSLQRTLVRGATGTFGLKIAGTGLLFLISVLLARALGPSGYGTYNYALSWITVLSVPAVLGLGTLHIREMSAYKTQEKWELMAGLLQWSHRAVWTTSLGLAVLTAGVVWMLQSQFDIGSVPTFWVALLTLPLVAVMRLKQSAVQGLNKVVRGQMPETLLFPLVFVAMLGGAYFLPDVTLTPPSAMGLNVVATGLGLGASTYYLRSSLPEPVRTVRPRYEKKTWLRSALILLFTSSVHIINSRTDILMLGTLATPDAVGIYSAAARGAGLVAFVMVPINRALGPVISRLHAGGEMKRLQGLVTKSARILLLLSLPIALGFITMGYWFLLIYGSEFTQGSVALAILSIGQLINVSMGSVTLLLNMTGHERDVAIGVGISAVLNIILNAVLIPKWGIEGAATATATSTTFWNVLLTVRIVKLIGIHPTSLGRISFPWTK